MKPGLFAAVVVAVFLLGFGVGRTSASPASSPVAAAPAAPMPMVPAQNAPMAMGNPDPGQGGQSGVTGTVAEVIQVPNYTYLRLNTPGGEEWAAIASTTEVSTGQTVTVVGTQMADFASSTLKKTFPTIWFGNVQTGASAMGRAAPSAPAGQMPGPMPRAAPSGATAGAMAAIQQAGGPLGLRVADVYSERKALVGQTVRVRGLVTRVSPVQGINYVHVKDGSGSAAAADDDLVVMTTSAVKVDDVATLEGKVVVDKDVGMGPRPVMLEDGKVVGN